MKWQNIFEAIWAFPSVVLDTFVKGIGSIYIQEKNLIDEGEFDEEDMEEYHG